MHSSLYSGLSLHKRAPLAHIARALSRWYTYHATIATDIAGAYSGPGLKRWACRVQYAERPLITHCRRLTQ